MNAVSIKYKLFPDDSAIFACVFDTISFEDMLSLLFQLRNDKNYTQGMNSCYDLTCCKNITGNLSALDSLADILNDPNVTPYYSRTSVIIPDNDEKIYKLVQGLVLMTSASKIQHAFYTQSCQQQAYNFVGFSPGLLKKMEIQKQQWSV